MTTGVGIAWNDPATGRFVHVNQECSRQFGYSTDEMQRMSIPELNPDHPPEQYHAMIAAIRASPNGLTFQTVHRRKDGSCYPAEVTAYVTGSATREWLISFFYDITARKAAEAELIQARDAAEVQVRVCVHDRQRSCQAIGRDRLQSDLLAPQREHESILSSCRRVSQKTSAVPGRSVSAPGLIVTPNCWLVSGAITAGPS